MKVLLVASEGAPFAKTGGLADVIGALPKALKKNGVDVRVIMPYYKSIKDQNIAYYKGYNYVRMGSSPEYAGIFHAIRDDIDYYFVDSDKYFSRERLYGYGDDGERFAFFDFAVLEALRVVDFFPDVIHCNDWQTGLIPYILKKNYYSYNVYNRIRTVYSIHNIQYQGIFPMDMMSILYMPYSNSIEFDGCINFMKTAIMESDIITTVSPTYKNEVLTDFYGYNMNNVLGLRYFDFHGILNGIDTDRYNPETDKYIFKKYSIATFVSGKKGNKKALLEEFGLDTKEDCPLFGMVTRLVDQKGIDLLMPIMDDIIVNSNAKFILMGSGNQNYEDYFRSLEARYPERFKSYIGYSDRVAQKIYAGADLFLMPSRFEPCGLGQLIAMRYGTLPLVRETGGLKDTVIPYNHFNGAGTGFSFTNYDAGALKEVMYLAIDTYNNHKDDWKKLIKQAMEMDFSWNASALVYMDLYRKLSQ
ncbi:starch synthase [Anaeroplasma bactoclasticum]|jgi:starch synthase|uniref:Glycogen synthase n=1 Tax=Anaeroplasma bactoclasticum TaxID=2088 RepID=A0A397RVV1_9MOLU|nr:glycogen synthase GlgA [Anaeroplasma bactoclasticum]RIA77838.1 starch synthase [Anaeroplasma bactoclasticum]